MVPMVTILLHRSNNYGYYTITITIDTIKDPYIYKVALASSYNQ